MYDAQKTCGGDLRNDMYYLASTIVVLLVNLAL